MDEMAIRLEMEDGLGWVFRLGVWTGFGILCNGSLAPLDSE